MGLIARCETSALLPAEDMGALCSLRLCGLGVMVSVVCDTLNTDQAAGLQAAALRADVEAPSYLRP